MINSELTTYSERRRIREEIERSEVQGESLDPATKCICDRCGAIHYKRIEKKDSNGQSE